MASVRAIALCHNVTPVVNETTNERVYQASSPDEVALVKFTEQAGVCLVERDIKSMGLQFAKDAIEHFEILEMFPFSSATKRMGIIVRDAAGEITFYVKGADVIMSKLVKKENSEWMPEETDNMAREGLRTLVFGMKKLTEQEFTVFKEKLHQARCSVVDRDANIRKSIDEIENNLELLCITGVEDKLQDNVRPTLELLANAGIKTWMLTGDKVETATCIAISSRLFKPAQTIFTVTAKDHDECLSKIEDFSSKTETCLVIDGNALQMALDNFPTHFISAAKNAPAVVCCRCTPTQKATVVTLLRTNVGACTCAIGDGGNDVSMILAADVGVGLEGKEGKQASLAADFSMTKFCHLGKLLVWHGRNSYKRTCQLSQFVMHRGLIISLIQFVFSLVFSFVSIAIYQGWVAVGY